MKITQKVGALSNCVTDLVQGGNFTKKSECIDFKEFNTTSTKNLNYSSETGKIIYYGNFGNYDDSGFISYIPVFDPSYYYDIMENLKNIKWISSEAVFVQAKIFYYNTNMNTIFSMKINFEKSHKKFKPSLDYKVINKQKIVSDLTIITLVFTILNFLTIFYMQIRPTSQKKEKKKELNQRYQRFFSKNSQPVNDESGFTFLLKKIWAYIVYFFEYNFIAPSFISAISK